MYVYITCSSGIILLLQAHVQASSTQPFITLLSPLVLCTVWALTLCWHSFCYIYIYLCIYIYIHILLLLRHKPEFPPSNLNPRPQGRSLREAWKDQWGLTCPPGPAILLTFLFSSTVLPPSPQAVLPSGPAPSPETCPPPRASVPHFHSTIQHPSPSPSRTSSPLPRHSHAPPSCPPTTPPQPQGQTRAPLGLPLAAGLTLQWSSHFLRRGSWSLVWGSRRPLWQESPPHPPSSSQRAELLSETCPLRWGSMVVMLLSKSP